MKKIQITTEAASGKITSVVEKYKIDKYINIKESENKIIIDFEILTSEDEKARHKRGSDEEHKTWAEDFCGLIGIIPEEAEINLLPIDKENNKFLPADVFLTDYPYEFVLRRLELKEKNITSMNEVTNEDILYVFNEAAYYQNKSRKWKTLFIKDGSLPEKVKKELLERWKTWKDCYTNHICSEACLKNRLHSANSETAGDSFWIDNITTEYKAAEPYYEWKYKINGQSDVFIIPKKLSSFSFSNLRDQVFENFKVDLEDVTKENLEKLFVKACKRNQGELEEIKENYLYDCQGLVDAKEFIKRRLLSNKTETVKIKYPDLAFHNKEEKKIYFTTDLVYSVFKNQGSGQNMKKIQYIIELLHNIGAVCKNEEKKEWYLSEDQIKKLGVKI